MYAQARPAVPVTGSHRSTTCRRHASARARFVPWVALVVLLALPAGCPEPGPNDGPVDPVGGGGSTWRILSETIFYDAGGNTVIQPVTQELELRDGGTWTFGSSSGTWWAEEITDADWTAWGIEPYGPSRKIMLNGWNGSAADGPIEEDNTGVYFIWVIYRTTSGFGPATVWLKFG